MPRCRNILQYYHAHENVCNTDPGDFCGDMGLWEKYKHHSKQAKQKHKTAASRKGHHLMAMGFRLLAAAPSVKSGKDDAGHESKVHEHFGKSYHDDDE